MTLSTPPTSPPTQSTSSASIKQVDSFTLPKNSTPLYHDDQPYLATTTTNALDYLGTSNRKAMSVMSYSSYQYASSTYGDDDDHDSVHSAPLADDAPAMPLSKQDLASSIQHHQDLLEAAQQYREQLAHLSKAAANFGLALEAMAKQKASMDAGQDLQAVAGLQFLISNHHHLLADTCYKVFEEPLAEQLEDHQKVIKTSQINYEHALQTISEKIRRTEAINLQQAKMGQRDLRQYRRTLQDLTRQVDELDQVKSGYYRHMQHVEQQHHQSLLFQTGWLVRAQVDVYELLSSKGLGDKTLEAMMQHHPDPFSAYATVHDHPSSGLFTVLPTNALIDPIPSCATTTTSTTNIMAASPPLPPFIANLSSLITRATSSKHHEPPPLSQSPKAFRYPDTTNLPLPPLPSHATSPPITCASSSTYVSPDLSSSLHDDAIHLPVTHPD
ncbi:hypothetical protein DM01DRAFT_1403114 [Hesseltinella vesiculosa]|uniref:IMD domain-containing protein n=1 Tax=Hesseltinella vesiculosa TaxID=101127 RepID=A0A1X2GX36_9FUNG|nr:hypothetical protein DM01DRAFT_1403114 [Hesseltinella vesiculosa]